MSDQVDCLIGILRMNQLDAFAEHLAGDGQCNERMIRVVLDQQNPNPDGIPGRLEFSALLDFFFHAYGLL